MPWKLVEVDLIPAGKRLGLCGRPYHGHPRGCKNFRKKAGCPPDLPPFPLRLDRKIWAIYTRYPLGQHIAKMQTAHPDWEEYQLANLLYWQGTSKRMLRDEVARFKQSVPRVHVVPRNAHIDNYIDVTSTMAKVGIRLEWPARTKAYEIAFAGTSVVGLSEGEWVKLVGRWPELYAVREVDRPESQRGLLGLTFGKFVVEKYTPGIGWDVRCRCGITETITSRAILIKALGCCRCAQQKPPPRSGGNVC